MNKFTALTVVAALTTAPCGQAATPADRSPKSEAKQAGVPGGPILVRPHSPVLGPRKARVTIVEFFDPSCEACRAVYPFVKQIMAAHPNDVRLVLRYAPFHPGSQEAIKILEAGRKQGIFVPVLEAVLAAQPEWHDDARAEKAWAAARAAGLNEQKARQSAGAPEFTRSLNLDVADIKSSGVKGTPTFFVNGKLVSDLSVENLAASVTSEVAAAK
jgi:protein-disulfide isomerase